MAHRPLCLSAAALRPRGLARSFAASLARPRRAACTACRRCAAWRRACPSALRALARNGFRRRDGRALRRVARAWPKRRNGLPVLPPKPACRRTALLARPPPLRAPGRTPSRGPPTCRRPGLPARGGFFRSSSMAFAFRGRGVAVTLPQVRGKCLDGVPVKRPDFMSLALARSRGRGDARRSADRRRAGARRQGHRQRRQPDPRTEGCHRACRDAGHPRRRREARRRSGCPAPISTSRWSHAPCARQRFRSLAYADCISVRRTKREARWSAASGSYASPTCHHVPEVYPGIGEKRRSEMLKRFFRDRRDG